MQSHILRIGNWAPDEDSPVFPVGSQPKTLLICPEDLQSSEVIPGHRYIFKTPEGWQEHQIWSEVIAYEMSLGTGVTIPRCLVAQDSDGRIGVLMEFFYGHPGDDHETRFVHGSDLLLRTIRDKKTGRPHGVRTNAILSRRYGVTDAVNWWGEILVFDALIGNSDRHPDNWGLTWRSRHGTLPMIEMAPAFDNGTSLGHEIPDSKLLRPWTEAQFNGYIRRGHHHCGWSAADDERGQHIHHCVRYLDAFPEAGEAMRNVLRFAPLRVTDILQNCLFLGTHSRFTEVRAQFVAELLRRRRMLIGTALGA